MLKTVIFDMDGVILDSEPLYYEAELKVMEEIGVFLTKEEHDSLVGAPSLEVWKLCKTKLDIPFTAEELDDKECQVYIDILKSQSNVEPISGIPELLKELKDKSARIALASSSVVKIIDLVVELLGIRHMFDVLVSGQHVENGKPAPDIFLLAAEKTGSLPEECVVIEDSKNGVLAAKKAGMKCIAFKDPVKNSQDVSLADHIVDDINKLDYNVIEKVNLGIIPS